MQWNYRRIVYFLKVAETLNFSRAARELYISPQSLNKQILLLEKDLGEPLFERTTRKMELTEFGRRLLQCFLPVQEEFQKATEGMEQYLHRRKHRVRIGFFQAISKREVVAPVSNYLRACEPEIQIELLGGEMDDIIEWLVQGKCDLLLTNTNKFEIWRDMEVIPFLRTPAKIVVSQHHPWAEKEQLTMKDLEQMPILWMERRKGLEEGGFYQNLQVRERRYTANFSSMVANLEMADCYGVFPPSFECMNQVQLQYLDMPKGYEFYYETAAIYPKDSRLAGLLKQLNTLAKEHVIHF